MIELPYNTPPEKLLEEANRWNQVALELLGDDTLSQLLYPYAIRRRDSAQWWAELNKERTKFNERLMAIDREQIKNLPSVKESKPWWRFW